MSIPDEYSICVVSIGASKLEYCHMRGRRCWCIRPFLLNKSFQPRVSVHCNPVCSSVVILNLVYLNTNDDRNQPQYYPKPCYTLNGADSTTRNKSQHNKSFSTTMVDQSRNTFDFNSPDIFVESQEVSFAPEYPDIALDFPDIYTIMNTANSGTSKDFNSSTSSLAGNLTPQSELFYEEPFGDIYLGNSQCYGSQRASNSISEYGSTHSSQCIDQYQTIPLTFDEQPHDYKVLDTPQFQNIPPFYLPVPDYRQSSVPMSLPVSSYHHTHQSMEFVVPSQAALMSSAVPIIHNRHQKVYHKYAQTKTVDPLVQSNELSGNRRSDGDTQPIQQDKKYACNQCDYQSNRNSNLSRHKETHAADRPKLSCGSCKKHFANKHNLGRHNCKKA
ncbi:C2H2-type zinc finger transcription factor [Phycomyces blakesleeanus]